MTDNSNIFSEIKVIKKLEKGKFQVFLTESKADKTKFALKVFPCSEDKISSYYKNESRFSNLDHENVIKIVSKHAQATTMKDNKPSTSSVLLMEYAPFGNFKDIILDSPQLFKSEKVIRTFFHQLINGLEYMHSQGYYHLDIKPENILLGDSFQLKIADFDLSYIRSQDKKIHSRGTKCYRAPELANEQCRNPAAADVYSAGIFLYVMKTFGSLPHIEDAEVNGVNFFRLFDQIDKSEFWAAQRRYLKKDESFFSEEFKQLISKTLDTNVALRWNIDDVKKSKWYNGPTYTEEEMARII